MKMTSSVASLAIAFLAACGSPEGAFKTAINSMLTKNPECIGSEWNNVNWPVQVSAMLGSDLHPILVGLQNTGMIETRTSGRAAYGLSITYEIQLTSVGEEAQVWSERDGFCVGRPEVVDIIRYTYADNGANKNSAIVEYRWHLTDVPNWVDPQFFPNILGLTSPVDDRISITRSSDGWHAGSW